jgi:CPA2 family monovalent cation:H+ antiporter-2
MLDGSVAANQIPLLQDLVITVAVAIPVVIAAQRLKVPSVVGFLLSGIVIGPGALGLVGDRSVTGISELGVILLLFTVGLELSLSRVLKLGRPVLQGGGIQVAGTIGLAFLAGVALGVPWRGAVFFGALIALSSTAIVLKILTDRSELDSPHGRVTVAILLFQDLCVVPLMLLAPMLAGKGNGPLAALKDVGSSLAVVVLLIGGGRFVVPWILERVVGVRNREIFTLFIAFLGLGSAFLTESFGLSLALGAFLAGLVISESEYGLQALSNVLPFRDTFSGIFFISIGMLLDVRSIAADPLPVVGLASGILVLKVLVGTFATRSLRRPLHVSVLSGLALSQVGEFSFVLAAVGQPLGLLSPAAYQIFLATSVLTMLATPFVIAASPRVAKLLCRWTGETALELGPGEKDTLARLADHVIIVGYGMNGRNLARALKSAGIAYVILEQNGHTVRRARLAREPIHFGDGARQEVLEHVGIERARVIVFAISSPALERLGIVAARNASASVRIVVRTRFVAAIPELQRLGADVIVPEEFETSIEIFARVLRLYGIARNVVEREVEVIRGEGYEMLRGLELPEVKLAALDHLGIRSSLDTLQVEDGSRAIGENPVSLALRRETGATVVAAVRDGQTYFTPDPDFRFSPGDTVLLAGDRDALRKSATLFRRPTPETSVLDPD